MMETYREVTDYLLQKGFVQAAELAAGSFRITEASQRHRNLRVLLKGGRGFFLKIGTDAERRFSIAQEAEIYAFFSSSLPARLRDTLLVRALSFDPERALLVLELLPDFENLWRVHSRRRCFLPGMAARLGRGLGELHRRSQGGVRGKLRRAPFHPTAIEFLAPSKKLVIDCSSANLEMIRIIQSDLAFCKFIEGVQRFWLEDPEGGPALIHGDLRFQNCCVHARKRKLRLVDWEFSGGGDPMWDAGCVLASLLSTWLRHAPMPTGSLPDQYLRFTMPIETMKQSAREFWLAYLGSHQQPCYEALHRLQRAMHYAAARLAQLAFEELRYVAQLTMHAISYLQLSRNLFERPLEAAIHLLGIPA
jgi:hypothetical protein